VAITRPRWEEKIAHDSRPLHLKLDLKADELIRGRPAGLRAFAPGHFDVVLSNVGMAGMNGWDFIDRLRAVDRDVAVLFITGWGLREEERIRLARLRVHRCLFKPVRPDDLDTAIQEALRPA
jgi:DNA-binding NarL/FixJ family response regulator